MKKYPSIEQFRNIIKTVRLNHDYKGKDEHGNSIYQHTENYPTLSFTGTIKLHGTNAGIVRYSDGRTEFQSRSRVLSLEQDNSEFMSSMYQKDLETLFKPFYFKDYVAIYGEWCGGSIQKGVALNKLPKMFIIFGIKVDGEWVQLRESIQDNSQNIYNILQFPTYKVDIDFNEPEAVQNYLIERTLEVEECCPVGKFFGVEGIGEGIVFTCDSNPNYKFKSKGEKHSVTKVKKLNPVDTEQMDNIKDFVESTVTENRLQQGLEYLKENFIEPEPKSTGAFLSWVVKDVLKEEGDTLQDSGFNEKLVKNAIVAKARVWFLSNF